MFFYFYLNSHVDVSFKILYNVTRRQFQMQFRQMAQKCPSRASISFRAIFDSCQWSRPTEQKAEKSWHFFYFDENGEKLKYLRNFLFLLFSRNKTISLKNWLKQYPTEILKILHFIWKKIGTYFRFYKRKWNRHKRESLFFGLHVNHKSRRWFFMEFCSF